MTLSYILMQNLRRNPLRASLTAAAFALPMAIFVAAISFVVAMKGVKDANASQLRLAVHQKTSITRRLPAGLRRKIEALDPDRTRLIAVCGTRWFGGQVPDTQNTLTSLAADVDTFPLVYPDAEMEMEDIAAWTRDRTACVVGQTIADRYGWHTGQRVTLKSTVPPYLELDFHIVKIMTHKSKANYFYLRHDYLENALQDAGEDGSRCNIFWIRCRSIEAMRSLQKEIDATFANSTDATKSEDENAFLSTFIQAVGDIPALMEAMAGVVTVVIVLVAGNTMMMSFRERTRELAIFKAIGFSRLRVAAIVLAESVFLAVGGAAIGIFPTVALLLAFPLQRLGFRPLAQFEVSPVAVVGSLGIALGVGIVAGLWPAYQSSRLRTVDALRRVA
ncbi:MAG: ABC transporter permease [Phycisphaerae bacterium]